jgi:hydroxypyruvate isomerase
MCDRITWAVNVCEEVGSPNVKLLFDLYHAQVMEGDLMETIRANAPWFHHYHTGGVPGRHEIDDTQEINYRAVLKTILATGFTGFVAHEFIPTTEDPFDGLKNAYQICNRALSEEERTRVAVSH